MIDFLSITFLLYSKVNYFMDSLGCKQGAKGKPTVNNQLDRDQIPDIQQSTPRFPTEPQATGTLREIMDEQLAVELSRNVGVRFMTNSKLNSVVSGSRQPCN